jgi:spore germination protein YaaH
MDTPVAAPRARARRPSVIAVAAVVGLGMIAAVVAWELRGDESWQRSGPPIRVHAWAPYWQPDAAFASFSAHSAMFAEVSMFAFRAGGATDVGPYAGVDPAAIDRMRDAAHQAGVSFTLSVIDDMPAGGMATVLADPATRAAHADAVARLAEDHGADGIDLDYEKFAFSDGRDSWAATRPNWVAFVTELAARLHASGKTLTVSAPYMFDGSDGDRGYWVYDYAAIGQIVDHVRVMAYDYSTSAPGPIAPIGWVRDVVAGAKALLPDEKIILGVPVYGYDWVDSVTGVCPGGPADQPAKRNRSMSRAIDDSIARGVPLRWDEAAQEQTYSYTEQLAGTDAAGNATTCTVQRTVWFADSRAVHARAWLAEREGLGGVSLWSLGSEDALTWQALAAAAADQEVWPEPATTSAP